MKLFLQNLFGNIDSKGIFTHSSKKFWFNMTSAISVISPLIMLIIGKIAGREFLNYLILLLPIAGALYSIPQVMGKKNAKKK